MPRTLTWTLVLTLGLTLAVGAWSKSKSTHTPPSSIKSGDEMVPRTVGEPITTEERSEFNLFWKDFQKAVSLNDKKALAKLSAYTVSFPKEARKACLITSAIKVKKLSDLKGSIAELNPEYADAWKQFKDVRPVYIMNVIWKEIVPELDEAFEHGLTLFIGKEKGQLKVLFSVQAD